MKKFKLMLVAFMAMVCSAAFADATPWATTTYKYTVEGKVVTITGFVTGYATSSMATVTIPNELPKPGDESKTVEVTAIASKAFAKNANITKVVIEAKKLAELNDAFAGCANLEEIDFSAAEGLKTITAGAFAGTKIKALDLSSTILTGTDNWFGTAFAESGNYTDDTAAAYNAKLDGAVSNKTIKTPATTIASDELDLFYPEIATTWTLVEKAAEDFDNSKLSVVKYNAVTGAELEAGDALTTKRVAAYNDARGDMVGTSKGDEVYYTDVEAIAYNAKLKGAVKAGDPYTNPAVTNATLASVKLPGVWQTIGENSFLFCTALTSIDFGKVKVTTQTLSGGAFVGTALTELDFTNTQVKALPAKMLVDAANGVKTHAYLAKVTLTKDIADLKANFAGCTALTEIDLTNVTTLNAGEFKGSGLTKITIPAVIATIPESAFEDCTALATVNFGHPATGTFTAIETKAFANTAIAKITIPAVLPIATADKIAASAFADCAKLTTFTYQPSAAGAPAAVVNANAFLGCNDGITFYTTAAYKTANAAAPLHTTYKVDAAPAGDDDEETTAFTAVAYKQTGATGKYFYKWKATKNVKIAKADAKVYAAYVDAGDGTLNMMCFRAKNSFYHIAAGDMVLMISSKESIPYRTDEVDNGSTVNADGEITTYKNGSSFLGNAGNEAADDRSALRYIVDKDGIKRSTLEADLPGAGYNIFAWVNTAKGTGFQKITSGTTFPQKTLYLYAKPEAAAAGRLNVVWRDENGNIEDETTAIQSIATETENVNGETYNLAGQKVNASYKGLVIKNGKKYMK